MKKQELRSRVLNQSVRESGEAERQRLYELCKEAGMDAMSAEIIRQILTKVSPTMRAKLLESIPELKEL